MPTAIEALQEMLDFASRIYMLHLVLVIAVALIAILLFIWWKRKKK